ncbi:uncharacterized protein LOC126693980 [Quercus robur]|uniref:uncharacterized protein LOC126693980 n=1 Tax=Quercus robur TaxID=38942 RepID=UPI002162FC72|nr:uncharacterized protein LOC126693980 [Quercus robur]
MKVESIETTLYKLFSEYERPKPMATTNVSSCVGSSSHTSGAMDDPDDDEDKEDDEFDHYESGRGTKTKKSQLDLYLEEPRLDKKKNSKLEVLSWWKEHYNRFLELSLMAQDLMSISITTVAFESSLSLGKKFLLHIDHVFYLRMWKLRYVPKVGYMDLKMKMLTKLANLSYNLQV